MASLRKRQKKGSRRGKSKGVRLKLIFFFFILPLIAGSIAGTYIAIAKGVPSIDELKHYKDIPSTKIYADDDTLIGELKLEKGIFVPYSKIPSYLINAVVASEDSHFWKHKGIDYLAILRAALKDILYQRIKEGGSTITQQLAKIAFLSPEKTFKRKVREIALAMRIEKNLTKEEIMELYLNRAYFGHGAYGVEMASKVYFGKSIQEITLAESTLIAGLLKAPSFYSPFGNRQRAKDRQRYVLSRMEEEGFITPKEYEEAEKNPLNLYNGLKDTATYNYFVDYVRKLLEFKHGADRVYKGDLRVYTTLNRKAQASAQLALQEGLRELEKRRGWRGPLEQRNISKAKVVKGKNGIEKFISQLIRKKTPFKEQVPDFGTSNLKAGDIVEGVVLSVSKNEAEIDIMGMQGLLLKADALWASNIVSEGKRKTLERFDLTKILKPGDVIIGKVKSLKGKKVPIELEPDTEAQGAIIAIDPHTGYIRAMVGGFDYIKSEYNRAIYSHRQAGSAFKPIIYSVMLDNGFTPSSLVEDKEIIYKGAPQEEWSPGNYDEQYYGVISMRDALAYSRNAVTVNLVNTIGIEKVMTFLNTLNLSSELPRDLTIALGSLSISPLELTSCYSMFANNGVKVTPIAIKYITDSKGRTIESNESEGEPLLSPQTAFLMTSMLKDVVNYGTGVGARSLGVPVAGKTGTTNEYRDAWFIGYTTELLAGVWVGFDDMKPLGNKETGARAALPVWLRFMSSMLEEGKPGDFEVPEGIVTYWVDNEGKRLDAPDSNSRLEFFKEDSIIPLAEQKTRVSNVSGH